MLVVWDLYLFLKLSFKVIYQAKNNLINAACNYVHK